MRLLILLLVVSLISCTRNDSQDTDAELDHSALIGYWSIHSAHRNGKETSTLDDAYMQFTSESELSTNIFGSAITQNIIWNDSTALVSDSSMTYRVNSIRPDSLDISFSLQNQKFNLLFTKVETPDPLVSKGIE